MPTIMGFNISTSLKTQKQLFLKKKVQNNLEKWCHFKYSKVDVLKNAISLIMITTHQCCFIQLMTLYR